MPTLSPPWYTFWNEVKATVGADPSVEVSELDTSKKPFVIRVTVANEEKAAALATVLVPQTVIGNITVDVQVIYNGKQVPPGKLNATPALTMKLALQGNPLFVAVHEKAVLPMPPSPRKSLYAIFTKSVIQFYNDDLSDYYNNYNNVTASVFRDVLNTSLSGEQVFTSTAEN